MARSLCLLIIFFKFALGSEEFFFWASVNTTNNIISSEQISFSAVMTPSVSRQARFLCRIDAIRGANLTTLEFLNLHKDEIFNCFMLDFARVKGELKRRNLDIINQNVITIPPVRFMIYFKPDSAIIGVFHSKERR